MKFIKIILIFFSALLFSCASIPEEAPVFSQELGKEIKEIENSHLNLVHIYFDLKRRNIRNYLSEEWLPNYAKNFFSKPGIAAVWKKIVNSGSEEDRMKFILVTAPELQKEIDKKYQELILPLNNLEKKLESSLGDKYATAKSINNSITSFLISASKVEENRERYLNMIGITDDKLTSIINKTESITSEMLDKASGIQENTSKIEENFEGYKQKLNDLLNNF